MEVGEELRRFLSEVGGSFRTKLGDLVRRIMETQALTNGLERTLSGGGRVEVGLFVMVDFNDLVG